MCLVLAPSPEGRGKEHEQGEKLKAAGQHAEYKDTFADRGDKKVICRWSNITQPRANIAQ